MEIEKKKVKVQKKCGSEVLELKKYSQPQIRKLGSMQRVTLDSSQIGTEDSGGTGIPNYTYV